MCGTLKHENRSSKIGNLVPVFNPFRETSGNIVWSGFATLEREDWWVRESRGIPLFVYADAFVEQDHTFQVPGGRIDALGLQRDVFVTHQGKRVQVGWKYTVKLMTRRARSAFERKIHKRWPVVHMEGFAGSHIFNQRDLIAKPSQGQLEMFG